jgi:hypothetical protein
MENARTSKLQSLTVYNASTRIFNCSLLTGENGGTEAEPKYKRKLDESSPENNLKYEFHRKSHHQSIRIRQ